MTERITPLFFAEFYRTLLDLQNDSRFWTWVEDEKRPGVFDLPAFPVSFEDLLQWAKYHPESASFWYERTLFYLEYA